MPKQRLNKKSDTVRVRENVQTADALRASVTPVITELTLELARRTAEKAMARKGTAMLCDQLYALLEQSAELVYVDGVDREDVGLMPMSTQLMAIAIYASAQGLRADNVVKMFGAVWDKAAEMNIIPARGN